MTKLPDDIIEIRNRALLDTMQRQVGSGVVAMVTVILIIGGFALRESNTLLVLAWVVTALCMQAVRYHTIRSQIGLIETRAGAKRQLDRIVLLASVNGFILASTIVFFPAFDEGTRHIYSMIIVGICMGFVVSSHGYLPIFLGFAAPQLFSLAVAWTIFPLLNSSDTLHMRAMLFCVLSLFLYTSCRNAFGAFEDNCAITAKLQKALAAETDANAAKTRFLAAASHDLRQPLHTVSMLSAALSLRSLDSESSSIANRINQAMAELSAELDSLLDISKMDAGVTRVNVTQFPVNSLVERLARGYKLAANEKNLDLHTIYSTDSIIETDIILLERILRNLLDNAIKYTDSGSIVVKVSERESMSVIQVKDTGVGIPESEKQRVYEEFYQLHNPERDRKNGLGLGLSIVGRIVQLLQANLELFSEPGKGSTFVLSLPRVVMPQPAGRDQYKELVSDKPSVIAAQGFKGVHTLVVEDDREVRRSMRTLLEDAGSRVSEAASTRQATQIVIDDVPDILLVDLRLPAGDSGYKTIEELRKIVPTIPVIIISGELITNDAQHLDIDNCEYFVKPVEMNLLFDQMQRMLKLNIQPDTQIRQSIRVAEY